MQASFLRSKAESSTACWSLTQPFAYLNAMNHLPSSSAGRQTPVRVSIPRGCANYLPKPGMRLAKANTSSNDSQTYVDKCVIICFQDISEVEVLRSILEDEEGLEQDGLVVGLLRQEGQVAMLLLFFLHLHSTGTQSANAVPDACQREGELVLRANGADCCFLCTCTALQPMSGSLLFCYALPPQTAPRVCSCRGQPACECNVDVLADGLFCAVTWGRRPAHRPSLSTLKQLQYHQLLA